MFVCKGRAGTAARSSRTCGQGKGHYSSAADQCLLLVICEWGTWSIRKWFSRAFNWFCLSGVTLSERHEPRCRCHSLSLGSFTWPSPFLPFLLLQALEDIEKALQLKPKDPKVISELFFTKGNQLREQNLLDKAFEVKHTKLSFSLQV